MFSSMLLNKSLSFNSELCLTMPCSSPSPVILFLSISLLSSSSVRLFLTNSMTPFRSTTINAGASAGALGRDGEEDTFCGSLTAGHGLDSICAWCQNPGG